MSLFRYSSLVPLPPTGPKGLLDELEVPADDFFSTATIRAVFNENILNYKGATRIIRNRRAYIDSKENTEHRYITCKSYYSDFFCGELQDSMSERDATFVAAISGAMLPDIGRLRTFNRHLPPPYKRLTRDVLSAAHGIWDEAVELGNGLISKECPPTRSGLFVAHINALYDVAEIQLHFDHITDNDLQDELRDTILPAFTFIDHDMEIGKKLNQELLDAERAIIDLFPKIEINSLRPTPKPAGEVLPFRPR